MLLYNCTVTILISRKSKLDNLHISNPIGMILSVQVLEKEEHNLSSRIPMSAPRYFNATLWGACYKDESV
jgi:hypothetical protein